MLRMTLMRNLVKFSMSVLFFIFFAHTVGAATFVSGTISTNTTSLTVASGAALTINPGVVVKLDMPQFFQTFNVLGALNVQGAPDNKVYFTSLKDDSVGGDTNGDGTLSSPKAQDWTSINFSNGSTGNFANAVIRYGGRSNGLNGCGCEMVNSGGTVMMSGAQLALSGVNGLRQTNGALIINNVELNNHATALWLENGTTAISASNIHDNATGISAPAGVLTLNDNSF